MLKVNPEHKIKYAAKFYKLIVEINKKGLNHLDHTQAVIKAGIESGMVIGGTVDEVQEMRTSDARKLAKDVVATYMDELKDIDSPN